MAAGSALGHDVKMDAVIDKRSGAAPAESPSTRKISDSARSVDVQSASFPGSVDFCSTPFRRTSSRAFFAASAALNACCVQRLHGLSRAGINARGSMAADTSPRGHWPLPIGAFCSATCVSRHP